MNPLTRPADTDVPLLDAIRLRWSPRAFSDRPICDHDLRTILTAAQWAPSTYNEQEWRFIIARKQQPGQFERAVACLVEANRQWARLASVLMFCVGRTTFTGNDRPNPVWRHDVGLATAQLVIQAMALGIYAHQMAGFDAPAVRRTYDVPAAFEPSVAVALGYAGRVADLPAAFREAELAARGRRSLSDMVFAETWGRAALEDGR